MSDMETLNSVLAIIKELGLPVVALYYIFKAYTARIDKVDQITDQYAKAMEAHGNKCEAMSNQIRDITEMLRRDLDVRQQLLDKLVSTLLEMKKAEVVESLKAKGMHA